jgi:hypothetical protein
MAQSVWHRDDLGNIYSSTLALALEANAGQSQEFLRGVAAGVLAVARAVGAPVRLPEWREPLAVVEIVEAQP